MPRIPIGSLQDNQSVNDCYMVRSRDLKPFRNRTAYFLSLTLGDKTGNVKAIMWEGGEKVFNSIKDGDVARVSGRTELYGGNLQIVVDRLSLAREGEYDLADFLPSSDRDRERMESELMDLVDSISGPLHDLLMAIFDSEMLAKFCSAPAAKVMHHACLGGLLEHTLEVVKICQLAIGLYPEMDRDLLYTGAILHDIGKIKEYVYSRDIDFSDQGRLLGHIVLGDEIIVERARRVPEIEPELLMKLRHMVLSHHGHYEWQSPKRPKTLEASVLHQADFFSSEVAKFASVVRNTTDSEAQWSRFDNHLERQVYLGGKRNSVLREKAMPEEDGGDDFPF